MAGHQPKSSGHASIHPALDALDDQIEQRYQDQEEKIAGLRTHREAMRLQAHFNREVQGPNPAAEYAVQHWAAKAGVKYAPGSGRARNTDQNRTPGNAARPGASRTQAQQPSSTAAVTPASRNEVHQKCEVLNCQIEFSSLYSYIKHTEAHNHSPCHPTRHLIDGKLVNEAPMYCCTTCGNLYKTEDICLTHMEETGHDHLQVPVAVPGYICLQCFLIFPNHGDCLMHQHKEKHWKYFHKMPDDNGRMEPQFLPSPLYDAFLKACKKVPTTIECLECNKTLHDSDSSQRHIQQGHHIMSLAEQTPADVWPSLMCNYTCVSCQRLYQELPPGGLEALHQCSPTMVGMIVENDCKSTFDFILRRSLLPISLVADSEDGAADLTPPKDVNQDTGGAASSRTDDRNDSLVIIGQEGTCESSIELEELYSGASARATELRQKSNPQRSLSVEIIGSPVFWAAKNKKQRPPSIHVIVSDEDEDVLELEKTEPNKSYCSTQDIHNTSNKQSPDTNALNVHKNGTAQRTSRNKIPQPSTSKKTAECDVCSVKDQGTVHEAPRGPGCTCVKKESSKQEPSSPVRASKPSTSKESGTCEVCTATRWRNPTGGSKAPECVCGKETSPKKGRVIPGRSSSGTLHDASPESPTGSVGKRKRKANVDQLPSKKAKKPTHELNLMNSDEDSSQAIGEKDQENRKSQNLEDKQEKRSKRKFQVPSKSQPDKEADTCTTIQTDDGHRQDQVQLTFNAAENVAPTPSMQTHDSGNRTQFPPILQNLETMRHIIFVDFDNWMGFFKHILKPLPDNVFVWGFYGGTGQWKPPNRLQCPAYHKAMATKCFYLHDKCGRRKDAADFAICMHVGRMDASLPTHIPFTILSGDKGFEEVESQMASSNRRVRVVNPHHQEKDELYTILLSMIDV